MAVEVPNAFADGALWIAGPYTAVRLIGLLLYKWVTASVAGEVLAEEGWEGVGLPWPLLSALFAYWVLVLRWNPRNGFARRILQGRRWKKEDDGAPEEPQA